MVGYPFIFENSAQELKTKAEEEGLRLSRILGTSAAQNRAPEILGLHLVFL